MHNCVGYGNYRYFVLFMAYLLVGCIYVIGTDVVLFYDFNKKTGEDVLYYRNLHDAMVYSFTVAISAGLAVSVLLFWHLYLCLTNQTTIEFYINMEERAEAKEGGYTYKNPFDKGWRKNLRRVFGEGSLCGAVLMSLRSPPPCEYPPLPDASMLV
jgi:palmitoyltransferase